MPSLDDNDLVRLGRLPTDPLADCEPYAPSNVAARNGSPASGSEPEPDSGRFALDIIPLADVAEEAIEWLWEPYIQRGALTTIEGPPGVGKSTLAEYIAAQVTVGGLLPGGDCSGEPLRLPKGNVLWSTTENSPARVMRPRLRLAGGDPAHFHIIQRKTYTDEDGKVHPKPFTMQDIDLLRRAFVKLRPVAFGLDPLTSYWGDTSPRRGEEVRAVLDPIAELCREFNTAGLLVRHLTKDEDRAALYRGTDGVDIIGAARSGLQVNQEHEFADPRRRGIWHFKTNDGPRGIALGFETAEDNGEGFRFTGATELTIADCAFRKASSSASSAGDVAEVFLRGAMFDEPREASALQARATEAGIPDRTLRRAKKSLDVRSKKIGKSWFWFAAWSAATGWSDEDWKTWTAARGDSVIQ